MNKPGTFKKDFEPGPFAAMIAIATGIAGSMFLLIERGIPWLIHLALRVA